MAEALRHLSGEVSDIRGDLRNQTNLVTSVRLTEQKFQMEINQLQLAVQSRSDEIKRLTVTVENLRKSTSDLQTVIDTKLAQMKTIVAIGTPVMGIIIALVLDILRRLIFP